MNMRQIAIGGVLAFTSGSVLAGSLTCEPGQEAVCEKYCAHAGGGVSSNPDGSTTCTWVMQSALARKAGSKEFLAGDWYLSPKPARKSQ